ncbi:MAG: V-type ATP synthase subunit A, partial [Bacillota bacterium]
MKQGRITKVSGPLVGAEGLDNAKMFDVVRVGEERLIGEIIEIYGDSISIQVYEETAGLSPGDPVVTTEAPLSVELGPGMLGSIFDGIQRPLEDVKEKAGNFITRGIEVPSLNREKEWEFIPSVEKGEEVTTGDVIGQVEETVIVDHKVMVPPGIEGTIEEIKEGEFTVEETVATVKTDDGVKEIKMHQEWPVRKIRPYKNKLKPQLPMTTGQRVIDTFFTVAKGGTASIPGPFGSGKTVVQHQLSKWADADIVVYIGCGERGNEMTEVLEQFPELEDPRTGKSLME